MAQRFKITADLNELAGHLDLTRINAAIVSNLGSNAVVVDETNKKLHLGTGAIEVPGSGIIEPELLQTNATDTNVSGWKYWLELSAPAVQLDVRNRRLERTIFKVGPFAVTANANLADLHEQFDTPATNPIWRDGFKTEMEALKSDAQTAGAANAVRAEVARDEAEQLVITGSSIALGDAEAAIVAQANVPSSPIGGALSAAIGDAQGGLGYSAARQAVVATVAAINPEPLDTIDGVLYGAHGNVLYASSNEGASWTIVRDFATVTNGGTDRFIGVRPIANGEVLVIKLGALFTSSGFAANPATATFTRRLQSNSPAWFNPFGVSTNGNRIVATSYVAGAGDFTSSRYLWLSTDNGATFNVIWDMGVVHPAVNAVSHCHLAAFDPYAGNRIWFSFHNTLNPETLRRVQYSDDDGATWTVAVTDTHMPTVGVALPSGMVFASDETPAALYRILREPGSTFEQYYVLRRNHDQMVGWGHKAVVDRQGIAHILWTSNTGAHPVGVISTDGYTAAETWTPTDNTADTAVNLAVTASKIHGAYRRSADGIDKTFTAALPGRGALPTDLGGLQGGRASIGGVAIGLASQSGPTGVTLGVGASAPTSGIAIGYRALGGETSTVIGHSASAPLTGNTVVGRSAAAAGTGNTLIGSGALSTGTAGGVAIGSTAKAHTNGTAIGFGAQATAIGGVAIGQGAVASDGTTVALGQNVTAGHFFSVGVGTSTTTTRQVQLGQRHIEMTELSGDPLTSLAANSGRIYLKDNGSGKTQLCVRFLTGPAVVLATEA